MNEEGERSLLDILGLSNAHLIFEHDIIHLDKVVPAGYPVDLGDDSPEYKEALKRLLTDGARVILDIRGCSMDRCGIEDGDSVELDMKCVAESGDIVIASIDGKETVKIYWEDEDGMQWLVPNSYDPRFTPILLDGNENVRIIGKVARIIKGSVPRGKSKDVMKAIRDMKKTMAAPPPSQRKIAGAILKVRDMIKYDRQWFAVYSVLYHKTLVRDYDDFYSKLKDIMGEETPELDLDDLKKMEVLSFTKPVSMWIDTDAPVHGKRFYAYLDIAKTFLSALV